jgi:hypothetical protein
MAQMWGSWCKKLEMLGGVFFILTIFSLVIEACAGSFNLVDLLYLLREVHVPSVMVLIFIPCLVSSESASEGPISPSKLEWGFSISRISIIILLQFAETGFCTGLGCVMVLAILYPTSYEDMQNYSIPMFILLQRLINASS